MSSEWNIEEVVELSRKKFMWSLHRELEPLQKLFTDDVHFTNKNTVIRSRSELLKSMNEGDAHLRAVSIASLNGRDYGYSVILNGEGEFRFSRDGEAAEIERLKFVEVYVRQNFEYKLASIHFNS